MNWNKITVGQYQKILPIVEDANLTDLDKLVKVICAITDLSELEVDSWPLSKINEYKHLFTFDFKKEAKKRVSVNGRHYRINWKVSDINAARYIEAKTYAADGLFKNLHKVMASCVIPQRKIGFFYFDKKYKAADHEVYANDMLSAPFPFVYNASLFFCKLLKGLTETTLSYSAKELGNHLTTNQIQVLRESLQSIMDGFIPQPLSQIMSE